MEIIVLVGVILLVCFASRPRKHVGAKPSRPQRSQPSVTPPPVPPQYARQSLIALLHALRTDSPAPNEALIALIANDVLSLGWKTIHVSDAAVCVERIQSFREVLSLEDLLPSPREHTEVRAQEALPSQYSRPAPAPPAIPDRQPWLLGFTRPFAKALRAVDRSLKGRILDALSQIADDPVTLRGDTIKPLTGTMSGLWRCRIGDYRLLYKPVPAAHEVVLLDFAARGAVYD